MIDKYKYNEFMYILSGCKTLTDAYKFSELYTKSNPELKHIIYSIVNGRKYESILDFTTLKSIIQMINKCKYKEDIDIIMYNINNLQYKLNDIQLKTIERLSKNKKNKPFVNNLLKPEIQYLMNNKKIYNIIKSCPHCNHQCINKNNTHYMICGHSNNHTGYDWKGCRRDWCFICGKMLCKTWATDQLFVESNRYHDDKCCKNHAIENERDYEKEYCQCIIRICKT